MNDPWVGNLLILIHCDEDTEGSIIYCLFKKCPQSHRVAMSIGSTPVLDFDGNSPVSDSQNEVNLGLGAAFRIMGDVKVRNATQKVSHHALGEMPGQVA